MAQPAQALAFQFVVQAVVQHVQIVRQVALFPQVVEGVLVARFGMVLGKPETARQTPGQALGLAGVGALGMLRIGQ